MGFSRETIVVPFLQIPNPFREISTKNLPAGIKSGRRVSLTSKPYVGRLSRQCGILDVSTLLAPTACHRDNFNFSAFIN
jgi:hypothetical protein